MATRSTIALEYADGTVGQIYCHWDGYLDHNGEILQSHYTDPFKVRELLDRGDTSTLDHSVAGCDFYKNRGEDCPQRMFANVSEYVRKAQMEEYNYILRRDGRWYVSSYSTNDEFITIEEAIKVEKEESNDY